MWQGDLVSFPKLHLVDEHVPAIFAERERLSPELAKTRFTCLAMMMRCMFGPEATRQDFCDHIDRYQLILDGWEVTEAQAKGRMNLCGVQGWEVPERFCVTPINSPAVLIYWMTSG